MSEQKLEEVYFSSRNRHDDTRTYARSSFIGNIDVSLSKLCDRGVCTEPTQVCLSQFCARCGATLDTDLFLGVKQKTDPYQVALAAYERDASEEKLQVLYFTSRAEC